MWGITGNKVSVNWTSKICESEPLGSEVFDDNEEIREVLYKVDGSAVILSCFLRIFRVASALAC